MTRLRWLAWFDLFVTGVFALPFVAWPALNLVMHLEGVLLGSNRVHALPPDPWGLFINLMGVLGVVWAIARLIVDDRRLWWIDMAGRVAVAALIICGLVALNLPWAFSAFVVSELGGAAVELVALTRKPLASESQDALANTGT